MNLQSNFIGILFILFVATDLSAQINEIVVWNGETAVKGSSWTNPNSNTLKAQIIEAYSGNTALEFKFKGNGASGWIGAGWDWTNMQVGPYGTDITSMNNFSFWLKVKGTAADFSFNLLCNDPVTMDQPQNHTDKVIVATYCTDWKDGEWHKIVVPLKDLRQPAGFDAKHVAQLQFFNTGGGDGSFFIDEIAFDDGSNTTSIDSPVNTENGYSLAVIPNPIDSNFKIKYSLAKNSDVEFAIYNCSGTLIKKYENRNNPSSLNEFDWSINKINSPGIYYIAMYGEGRKVADCKLIKK